MSGLKYIAHTHGHLMNMRLRLIGTPSGNDVTYTLPQVQDIDALGYGAEDFREMILNMFSKTMEETNGITVWLPRPQIRFVKTHDPELPSFYWIHTPVSNQHRVKYIQNAISKAVAITDLCRLDTDLNLKRVVVALMDQANFLDHGTD